MQPTKTLQEQAKQLIREELEKAEGPNPRVIWWDDGGYLEQVLKEACSELDLGFTNSKGKPLSLRKKALKEPKGPRVWYVPEGRNDRDWFLDIEETGGKIEKNIQELASSLYEGAQSWDICEPDISETDLENIAEVLLDELTQKKFLPTFTKLKSDLITKGGGQPLEYILKRGWEQIDDGQETVREVCQLLKERGIKTIAPEDETQEIVKKVRKWSIAQWLVNAGLDNQLLPKDYQEIESRKLQHIPLKKVIKSNPSAELDCTYLREYWPKVINKVKNPENLVNCPVEGTLEKRLWQDWIDKFKDRDFVFCEQQAQQRYQALRNVYPSGSAWVQTWYQAQYLVSLASQFKEWEERAEEANLVDLYTNKKKGTWKIEKAVRHLIVSGEPEKTLPEEHPATESLPEQRERLLNKQYRKYLDRLSKITLDAFSTGSFLTEETHAYKFWNNNRKKIATGESVAIFYVDALRFDLARELAERLCKEGYEVTEKTHIGCLPSETEFGMGALTPGDTSRFKITIDNGEIYAWKNGRKLKTGWRKQLLEEEGWEVTDSVKEGWAAPRVAYFDLEIDKYGENELDEIEQKLSRRIDQLTNLITEIIEGGDWQRVFVVTDHGFVLLPEGTSISGISAPQRATKIKRRWIAGTELEENSYGVLIDDSTRGIGYLNARIKLLVDPFHRFKKQGISDSRFFHGGALPQEFILNFLEVEKE